MTKEEILLESTERYKCNPIIENDKWFVDNDLQIIYDAMKQYHQSKVKENELLHSVSNQRELLIAYEIKMRCCTNEQAEQIVDSYLAVKNFCN